MGFDCIVPDHCLSIYFGIEKICLCEEKYIEDFFEVNTKYISSNVLARVKLLLLHCCFTSTVNI